MLIRVFPVVAFPVQDDTQLTNLRHLADGVVLYATLSLSLSFGSKNRNRYDPLTLVAFSYRMCIGLRPDWQMANTAV